MVSINSSLLGYFSFQSCCKIHPELNPRFSLWCCSPVQLSPSFTPTSVIRKMYATKEKSKDEPSGRTDKEEAAAHSHEGTEHWFLYFNIYFMYDKTKNLVLGLCDCRKQLSKHMPRSRGRKCRPLWGQGQFTDNTYQGPRASQARLFRAPHTSHGPPGDIVIVSSSSLPSTTFITRVHDASSASPASPECGSKNASSGHPAPAAWTCTCASW